MLVKRKTIFIQILLKGELKNLKIDIVYKNTLTEVCIFNKQVSCFLQSELLKLNDLVNYNIAQIMFRASNKLLPVNI